tara:strand:+ start:5741 stop:6718 length:978 start_codon:yes stop_codon:yes gene_type:complete
MKAAFYTEYGPPEVIKISNLSKPVAKQDEVLVRVHAATVIKGDCEFRAFTFPAWFWLPLRIYAGVLRPKRCNILGQELSGVVEAVGDAVTRFKPGDEIFAPTELGLAAHAEYKCLKASGVISHKPSNAPHGQAATLPTGGLNALHYMRLANIKPDEKVVIVGACGNIGSFAVQLAKYFGAEVTGVDSADKLQAVRDIGADHVIDYATQDFTQTGDQYDVIFDTAGHSHYGRSLQALAPGGRYLLANPGFFQMLRSPFSGLFNDKTVLFRFAKYDQDELDFLGGLLKSGDLKPLIDRDYSLADIVGAHRYLDSGGKVGNITITVTE